MNTETLSLETPDGPMPAYVGHPEGEPRGGIVVVQEAFGVTEHIQDVARRVAAAGYLAIAPSVFHRSGSPVFPYDGDFEAIRPVMGALTREGITTDLAAAIGWLRDAGIGDPSVGVVGFCMGGSVSTFAASAFPVGAAVSFYGGGVSAGRFGVGPLADLAPGFVTPWLGLYGSEDASIPPDDVEMMRTAAAKAAVETDVVVYPGAQHGFHCDDRPAAFDEEAARGAWRRTLDFFAAHLA